MRGRARQGKEVDTGNGMLCGMPEDTVQCAHHGPNNYKDTKPIMSSLLVFNRVYRLEIQSIMLVFSTPLVN
jgi:hypothetical protein